MKKNAANVKGIRDVPASIWIRHIFAYLSVDESLAMGQVSVFFNRVTRSPLFIKFFVRVKEKTVVDVSADHFDIQR